MTHVLSMLVENHQGVLSRIAGLFSGRGYNLESITAGITTDPQITRITLVCSGDDNVISQIKKQLNKLVDIIKVTDLTQVPSLHRELALIKVSADEQNRSEIMQIVNIFRAKVIDISPKTLTVEITGKDDKISAVIGMLRQFGIRELARTGAVALKREFQGEA